MPEVAINHYSIVEFTARGAESYIYRATTDDNRVICVKEVRRALAYRFSGHPVRRHEKKLPDDYADNVRHIKNEFSVGRALYGDGAPVVQIYDLRPFRVFGMCMGYDLLMEYIEGEDLGGERYVAALSFPDKLNFFFQAALALGYIHQKGYVHLDIKPPNLMVSERHVKIIDFGLSQPMHSYPTSLVGTRGYLSPEQIAVERIDAATDIFALAHTFNVIFGGNALKQDRKYLAEDHYERQSREDLKHNETPRLIPAPDINRNTQLVDLLKRCTIPKRSERISNTSIIVDEIRKVAKMLGIKLNELE